ncbi:hypothetical protein G7Z17_g968 [Cylindrodendrum hubeiense]|uniref:Zn(2)-C6 fungal-type domain-containing protein n=1 Tax=Cylindrodendrum hubeiense TaxID=595255 RepID=A0A9P5HLS4_9HYPO|nr:hypothetical protein G7Z17_g968 [Cylindrodendrum hubeiense]
MEPKFHVLRPAHTTLAIREHKKRKFHVKSRSGCLCCKRKRVKCDETRPVCKRCARSNRSCFYEFDRRLERDWVQDQGLNSPLAQPVYRPTIPAACVSPRGATPVDSLLHHYYQNYEAISGGICLPVWSLPGEHGYLLAAVLAVSACHLRHHAAHPREHEIAECHQQRVALEGFQAALLQRVDQERSDAMLTTAMFLNLMAFAFVDDARVSASWVFGSDRARLGWLSLQLGLKPLLMATARFRDASALQPMFEASGTGWQTLSSADLGFTSIPSRWTGLLRPCTADRLGPGILREPLRALAESRLTAAEPCNIFIYLQFVGKLGPEFVELLHHQDDRALWAFGYWLGLLGRFRLWWLRRRVERDFGAIAMHLRRRLKQKGDKGDEGAGDWNVGEAKMWENLIDDLEGLERDWGDAMR